MANDTCIRLQADIGQIKRCREKLKTNSESFLQLGQVLALAGNDVRLKILFLLDEELCPCDLSDMLGMSIPAISQHLRKMKDGGIIRARKEGQTIFYSITTDYLKMLRSFFRYIHALSAKTELV